MRRWIRLALVWTIWLAPLQWCHLLAADSSESAATSAPWKRGISTWNGSSYSPSTSPPSGIGLNDAAAEPAPYTEPVDPSLYTQPLVTPYDLGIPTTEPATPDLVAPTVPPVPVAADMPPPVSEATATAAQTAVQPSIPLSPTMGDQIESGVVIETPPLREETLRWYQYPWRWMTVGWQNHAEFGLDGSAGNAETLALQTGAEVKRKTDLYTLAFDFDYRFANNRDLTTENNGRYNIDYDRLIDDSPWSMFGKFGLEWDKFKAFDLRLWLNGGVGYYWIRNERTTFVSRFGAGASREIGAPSDLWKAEAVFGLEGEHQLNKRNKFKGRVDYFPVWEDFTDYRIVTDLAWELLLNDAENLSLRLGVTDRYDSTPQGARPNDFYYSALLLLKF